MGRQLWFIRFRSRDHDKHNHPGRFDHWLFYLPETPVRSGDDLGPGRMIQVAGSPVTGFSQDIKDTNIGDTNTPYFSELLMENVDLDKVTTKGLKQGGFARSENPDSGKPNCQGWLFVLANQCVEDGIMDESVVTFLRANRQD
ncbi:hypothetical protein ABW20_dc0108741 [Dactylellina cionopaga]|nr:hypothetical protein ABW20_dc0108741 [Dactylellina cionopaga]